MIFVSLLGEEDGEILATAAFDDAVWLENQDKLRDIHSMMSSDSSEGLHPSKAVHSYEDAVAWISGLRKR